MHGVSYLSLHLHAVCPFMARCAMGRCNICHGVVKVYYEQGWYTTGTQGTGVRAIWIACSVHSVSYLPGPQVSLTVTGCVLRGILAFTDPPPCQPLFASQEMERGIFKTYMDLLRVLREDYILRTTTDMT